MYENQGVTEGRVTFRPLDVRLLAALDLHGWSGSRRRRRLIVLEFVAGAAGGLALGLWALVAPAHPEVRLFGIALLGCGLNYVALTLVALRLCRPGALDAELAGFDLGRQLKRYSFRSLWLFVPFLVAVLAVVQARRLPGDS